MATLSNSVASSLSSLRAGSAGRTNARRLLLDLPAPLLAAWAAAGKPGPVALGQAIALAAQRSDFLVDALCQDPECQLLLAEAACGRTGALVESFSRREVQRELARAASPLAGGKLPTEAAFHDVVARLVRKVMVRIGLRDIFQLADMPSMMREISDLSELVLRGVMAWFTRELTHRHGLPKESTGDTPWISWGSDSWSAGSAHSSVSGDPSATGGDASWAEVPSHHLDLVGPGERPAAFCIVTMGKGGGRELNFSSDIDLVFIYSSEGDTTGVNEPGTPGRLVRQISNHAYFNRLAELLIGFLTRPGPAGSIYRVDMRLRPDGAHGPLARSLASFRDYFAEQALAWERVAYAKARAVAGPRLFRDEVEKSFRAFAFAEIFNTEILAEINLLKSRIDQQAMTSSHRGLDIKRGHGGIREIEFLLVALQLLYSNDVPGLRDRRSTLGLLDALVQAGILPMTLGDRLRRDYLFLRHLEQRLQLLACRQTHVLPAGPTPEARMEHLRRVWDAPEELDRQLKSVREHVEEEFRQLFHEERAPVPEAMPLMTAIFDERQSEESLLPHLEVYRVREVASVAALRRLALGTREVYTTRRERQFFETIFASLMNVAARVPFPDAALRHFEDFIRRTRSGGGVFELLAEYPRTLETVLRTTGHGDFLAGLLASQPEYLDELLSPETLGPDPPRRDHLASLTRQLRGAKSMERRLRIVRRHRSLQTLALGVRHVLELDPWPITARELSRLARETLIASLPYCSEDATLYPRCEAAGFTILALGKLSLQELSWFSDLDVVFATEGGGEEATQLASALIEFMGKPTPEGVAYEVDARLRPMGRTAPLVPTRESIVRYFHEAAETWEFLAFTRATYLGGSRSSAATILEGISDSYKRLAASARDAGPEGVAAQTAAMRQRMEASVGKGTLSTPTINLKRGHGGIVDLEFSRQVSTLTALALGEIDLGLERPAVLAGADRIAGGDAALREAWSSNYAEMRRIEAANRLLRGDGKDIVPRDAARLEALSFATGFGAEPELLLDHLTGMLEANRTIFGRTIEALPGAV